MSLLRFLQESTEVLRQEPTLGLNGSMEVIRERWLEKSKHAELVRVILANWTSGNCVQFMKPVSTALLNMNDQALHRKLWAMTIKRQIASAFANYSHLKSLHLSFEEVVQTDFTGFDEFDFNDYDDKRRATAFLMSRLVDSLQAWRDELRSKSWSETEVEVISAQVRLLKKPNFSAK